VPTYQYSCTECGHSFEQVQSFSEDSLTSCPVCTGRLRKVFNAVGVVFKGSGFYRTDSRSPAGDGAGAGAGDKTEAAKTQAGKTDAGKTEGGKTEGGKTEGGKTGGAAPAASGGAAAKGSGAKGSSDAA